MKILFITDLYPVSDKETKTPKTLYTFVKEWEKSGHEVHILKPNFLLNSFLRNKPFYKTGQYNDVYNVNYVTPFLFNVTKKLPELDYDVIVSHMPSGIIFSNKLQGKKICAVHVSDLEVLTNPIYSIYFKKQMLMAYKNACGIACRSQVLKNKFLKLFPQYESKTFLCESGIDFEPQLKTTCEKKTIITCANLIPRKNIDKLILALNNMPEIALTVIGSGKEYNKLKGIAGKNVYFTGHLEHSEVIAKMKKSDIFILPSENETFGMVYLEAMASGCVTVGVKNDGIDGIIKDGDNGFLIKPTPKDIEAVIQKIKTMQDNELKTILQNCYNTVNCYKSADCADRYLKNIFKFI
ncbi:glycosyltransferase family 4 protein [bacterium]|nr:glycosyltransferase family 4 protein [bacterium]